MQKLSFDAVADANTTLLVLGSLPGEASLARGQYYAHPQNQFWRLMEAATGLELTEADYAARLAGLRSAGVGLWDVIRSAARVGSLDAAIRGHAPNRLSEFVATLPALRAVAFNGAKASEIGRRALGAPSGLVLVTLPSSSPAHTLAFERKRAAWMTLQAFLA